MTSIFPILSVNHFISDYLLNPWNLVHLFTTQLKMLSWISSIPAYSQGEKTWLISETVGEMGPFHFFLWWDRVHVRSIHSGLHLIYLFMFVAISTKIARYTTLPFLGLFHSLLYQFSNLLPKGSLCPLNPSTSNSFLIQSIFFLQCYSMHYFNF